jgi:hypothetical protein
VAHGWQRLGSRSPPSRPIFQALFCCLGIQNPSEALWGFSCVFSRPLLAFGRAKSGRLRDLPALVPARDVAAAFLALALGRRLDPDLSHVSNVCPAISRGALAVIRAIGPAKTFKRLAAAATVDPGSRPDIRHPRTCGPARASLAWRPSNRDRRQRLRASASP